MGIFTLFKNKVTHFLQNKKKNKLLNNYNHFAKKIRFFVGAGSLD